MITLKTSEVFGVTNSPIATYIERPNVDNLFLDGLQRNKHIIVYGASKQGKTSLTNKHLTEDKFVRVNCSHNSEPLDIYKSILRQLKIEILEERTETKSVEGESKISVKAKFKIPFFSEAELGTDVSGKIKSEDKEKYQIVEYNLNLAQDISEILKKFNFQKRIILENFHYLRQDTQSQLAYDLRIFEDYNILFIILGIWREKNRLSQYNGDLLDRLIEIPVEPWEKSDLLRIISEGEPLLNVDFSDVKEKIIDSCFDSVGVLQELCKECCYIANIHQTQEQNKEITLPDLESAIYKKLQDYSSRHLRSLETFVDQKAKSSEAIPLYMAYYFIKVIVFSNIGDLILGFHRKNMLEKIKSIHHRPDDVRASDIGYFFQSIVSNQIKKNIIPPIFDFDPSPPMIKIIDSTFYFFLRNSKPENIMDEIPIPVGLE